MAGHTDNGSDQELVKIPESLAKDHEFRDRVKETAAKLYGQGYERKDIAKMLLDHLVPNKHFEDGLERPHEQRISQARNRLRQWERQDAFRQMIWDLSVVKLDLQTPAILGGIAKKARRGRVDAARLALEITGRHNPKGDQTPTQIILAVEGIPRPSRVQAVAAEENTVEIVDGEVMEEADDEV